MKAASLDQHHGNPSMSSRTAFLTGNWSLVPTVTGPSKMLPLFATTSRVVEFQWHMSAVGEVHDESGAQPDEGEPKHSPATIVTGRRLQFKWAHVDFAYAHAYAKFWRFWRPTEFGKRWNVQRGFLPQSFHRCARNRCSVTSEYQMLFSSNSSLIDWCFVLYILPENTMSVVYPYCTVCRQYEAWLLTELHTDSITKRCYFLLYWKEAFSCWNGGLIFRYRHVFTHLGSPF